MGNHLWEAEHSYNCCPTNYFGGSSPMMFSSWADFLEEWGNADLDYNLVFRWDWTLKDKNNALNRDTLEIFIMGQRKGHYKSALIEGIRKEDEQDVRDWLLPRLHHLLALWAPLVPCEALK